MRRILFCVLLLMLFSIPCLAESSASISDDSKPLKFSRELSDTYIGYGEYVTITYTVRNEGTTPLKNVVVADVLVGEVGSLDLLAAGEKRTFSARVAITEESVSSPYATYELNGAMDMVTREAETVHLADVQFTTLLEADKTNVAPGEVVTLRITLSNTGNIPLSRLRLKDSVLGDLGILLSELKAGQEYTVTKTVQIKSTTTFHFEVTGYNAGGTEEKFYSNELTVFATPVASDVRLSLTATPESDHLDAPGEVNFSLLLDNDGTLELRNVRLYEQTIGDIRTLLFVPVGEMELTHTCQVEKSGTYVFAAEISDSVGDMLTVTSNPVEITVEGISETPEETAVPKDASSQIDTAPYRLNQNSGLFYRLMLATSGLLLLMGAVFFFSARMRENKARRLKKRSKKTFDKKRRP